MYLINGQSTERLAVNDRGVQFGDGCFTTARIAAGGDCLVFPSSGSPGRNVLSFGDPL
ncbi:4-amino-4-deoxychorismate lyase [Salmonella enterica subsp. enterica]|nr:4-amino-4-deoxychorismate lyase [Salmonella enterica subsp. enterica]